MCIRDRNKADELGLSRRKTKQTNVDYVLLLAENNTIDLAFMPKDKTVYSLHESVLLIILAALDKVYDADAIALGIPMYEVGTFITKVGEKLAQRELCSPDEATKHSAMKLVHNSKFALLKIVNGLDEEQVIESAVSYTHLDVYKRQVSGRYHDRDPPRSPDCRRDRQGG